MNERKRKISTCVYVHSILHHWACILIFEGYFIEYVCWWEFVCELSEILFFFVFTLSCILREMSDLLLGALGHCPFHHYIHCWCDFTSCWIWANHHSSLCFFASPSFLFFAFDSSSSSHPLFEAYSDPFQVWYSLYITITHLIINLICFIASLLLSSHWASSGPWHTRFFVHVAFHTRGHGFFIIGYLSIVSLHLCHPITLAYVTSRVLRPPWGYGIRCRLR